MRLAGGDAFVLSDGAGPFLARHACLRGRLYECGIRGRGRTHRGACRVLAGVVCDPLRTALTLQMTVLWAVIMLSALYSPVAKFLGSHIGLILTTLIVLFWGAWPLLAPRQLDPESQYECRFLDLLAPLVLTPVAVILAVKPKWLAARIPDLTRLAAMMLVAQSLWQISATHQWQRYIAVWKHILPNEDGPIRLSNNDDFGKFDHLCFTWANPCMSLTLGPRRVQSIIMPTQPPGWMPFNPFNPKSLPDLKRYGVDYSDYIEALKRQGLIQR